jgi:hypothetical protein
MRHAVVGLLWLTIAPAAQGAPLAPPGSCLPTASDSRFSAQYAERYIRDSEREWAASVATNDASILRRILANNFVWVLDDQVLGKADAIRFAEEGPEPFLSNEADDVQIRFFGPVAVAQGSEHWTKSRGSRRTGRFIWTDTWLHCGGAWQIVNAQDNPVGPAQPVHGALDPLDAVTAAPASHHIIFENDRVRVLSVTIPPGRTEPVHTHDWPSIMRVEAPQPITYIHYGRSEGRLVETSRTDQPMREPAEAEWMEPEGPHAVRNRGTAEYRAIRIELKPAM